MGETLQYSNVVSHIANAMKHYIFKQPFHYQKRFDERIGILYN